MTPQPAASTTTTPLVNTTTTTTVSQSTATVTISSTTKQTKIIITSVDFLWSILAAVVGVSILLLLVINIGKYCKNRL